MCHHWNGRGDNCRETSSVSKPLRECTRTNGATLLGTHGRTTLLECFFTAKWSIEILTSNVWSFGLRSPEVLRGAWGEEPSRRDYALRRDTDTRVLTPPVRGRHMEEEPFVNQQKLLPDPGPASVIVLHFPASRIVRNKILLFTNYTISGIFSYKPKWTMTHG